MVCSRSHPGLSEGDPAGGPTQARFWLERGCSPSLARNPSLFQSKNEPGEAPGTVMEEAPFRFRF